MVHSTADSTVFPALVFQVGQFPELLPDLIRSPTFLGQGQIPVHFRTSQNELFLEVIDSRCNLLIDHASHTREAQESRDDEQLHGEVDIADASEETVTAERVKGLANVAEYEEYKYNVAESVELEASLVSYGDRRGLDFGGGKVNSRFRGTYMSRLAAVKWALDARP